MPKLTAALRAPLRMAPSRTLTSRSPYPADPTAAGPTFRYERSLPHLPVPTLSSTASKYLESLQPLLTPSAYANSKSIVDAFVESPQAAQLQHRLEARAAEPGQVNWLAQWWNDAAYMAYRDPVVVFVSYFYAHLDDRSISGNPTPARRAAKLLSALLEFRELVETEQLEPDKARNTPMAMSSYKWLFNASRYPEKPADTARKFSAATNNHIVFIRKNKFFEVSVAENGELLTAAELESQVEKVIEMAGVEKGPAIGALTSQNRDIWTDDRKSLVAASPINAASLERIESAIIIVALDDHKPVTREDISWQLWVGDGRNRFFDKHQLIVFDNGRSGFLGEHSCMDGTPTLRLNEFMVARANKASTASPPARTLPPPKPLSFSLSPPSLTSIATATDSFDTLTRQHTLCVLHYEGYGKNVIKSHKASPDAWAQLVKQLAFKKLYGRPAVTYESAQTRKFQLGRTEVIRSASIESKKWTEAMLDPTVDNITRAKLFRQAIARHLQYAAWAADAQGVDRHLFGLKKLLNPGEPVPEIYADPAFAQSSHWELSTSQLSSPFIDGWGYGEVVPDGYGLAYSIGDYHIRWTITSLKNDVPELRHYLAEAATETRVMMERAAKAEAKAKL